MTDHIFVSYSRVDNKTVEKLSTDLKKAGIKIWLDKLNIPKGATWDVEIEKALQSCDCVLFVVSKSSVASKNVLDEVYFALDQNKRVIPIKINECSIPYRLRRLEYLDLSLNYQQGLLDLLKAIPSKFEGKIDTRQDLTSEHEKPKVAGDENNLQDEIGEKKIVSSKQKKGCNIAVSVTFLLVIMCVTIMKIVSDTPPSSSQEFPLDGSENQMQADTSFKKMDSFRAVPDTF